MATKRAIELGHRMRERRRQVEAERAMGWVSEAALFMLERAAIAVGEERERGRQAKKRKSAGTCTRCGMMKAKHGVTAVQSGACAGFVSAAPAPEPRR